MSGGRGRQRAIPLFFLFWLRFCVLRMYRFFRAVLAVHRLATQKCQVSRLTIRLPRDDIFPFPFHVLCIFGPTRLTRPTHCWLSSDDELCNELHFNPPSTFHFIASGIYTHQRQPTASLHASTTSPSVSTSPVQGSRVSMSSSSRGGTAPPWRGRHARSPGTLVGTQCLVGCRCKNCRFLLSWDGTVQVLMLDDRRDGVWGRGMASV